MACLQCGHENPNSAKFCNECGALVDRRKSERRQGDRRKAVAGAVTTQEGVAARRASPYPSLTPGNENSQGHTPARQTAESFLRREGAFRGPEVIPVEDARESGAPLRAPVTTGRREAQPERISGPSFLGLASGDSSGSDYLLDDPPRSTWRAWLVLIILVTIGVLFYLQWRTNWRANPHELPPPPAAPTTPSPTAPQSNAAPASDATGVPAASNPQQANAAPDRQDNKADATKPPDKSAASASDQPSKATKADDQSDAADDANPPSDEEAPAAAKKSHREPISRREPADPSRADPGRDPMLYMAQKYLRGGSAGRNCDQAMVYLKAANQRASVPARSQMGALYATGTCVPLDRVRAYQWFSSALNLEPNNEDLLHERTNLWTQMSSDERQQAVK